MIYVVLTLLGLCLGSFVNALVWRIRNKRDWVKERSVCPNCGHQLAAKDLVPVFSWLMLKGKCRYCHKPIEDTPLVELGTAATFTLSYVFWPYEFESTGGFLFIFWLIFLVGFMALLVYDLRWMILPNSIVYPLLALALVQVLVVTVLFDGGREALLNGVWGVLVASGIFYVIFQVSGGKWIGGGDVKLGAVLGLIVGGPLNGFLLLFFASLAGSVVSIPLLIKKKAGKETRLPFGPFLILASMVVYLFGASLADWYKNQFLLY